MRKLSIFAFATVAALSFAGAANATPLGAAGTLAATTNTAAVDVNGGVTDVRWRQSPSDLPSLPSPPPVPSRSYTELLVVLIFGQRRTTGG